uniref:hypothetical protein n=1 Tax=Roseivirga sp. TaxID=1964215 RepID=UPI004047CD3D
MKKKPGLFKRILNVGKSIIEGAKGGTVGIAMGAIEGIKGEIQKNKASEIAGEGNTDKLRLFAFIATLALIVALIAGWVDGETFKQLVKLIQEFT